MYRLSKFGTTNLLHLNMIDAIGSGRAASGYFALPEGGVIDLYGSATRRASLVERTKTMRVTGLDEDAVSDLYFGLMALQGKKDRLFRQLTDGSLHWVWARLVEVQAERNFETARYRRLQDMSLVFECQNSLWTGTEHTTWLLDGSVLLDGTHAVGAGEVFALTPDAATSVTITIGTSTDQIRRAPSKAVKILIDPGATAITAVSIARSGGETLTFAGTIDGDRLVIDCGLMQCYFETAGTDAYDDLTIAADADMASWFALEPGDNDLTVTLTGGGSGAEISVEYSERWY